MNAHRLAATAAAALVLAGPFAPRPAVATPDTQSRTAVCAGVSHCHRVAVIDVDGDHRADRVGWRQLSKRFAQIRVYTADGERRTHRVDVRYWPGGGTWGDAAWIDGRPGAELLVGSVMGAHTPQYTMLTYRKHRLVVERSPGGGATGGRWYVDSALMDYAGWHRHVGPRGRITMTGKDAWRNDDGTSFEGHDIRYAWHRGHWNRLGRTARAYRNDRQARKIGGWHVGHLQRWPGLRR